MPEVAFVMSAGQRRSLRELATTIAYELGLQGVPSSLHLDGFPKSRPGLVHILLDPCDYLRIEGEERLPGDAPLRRTVLLCTEPVTAADDDEHLALLRRAGALFVLDRRTQVVLERAELRARLLRPGYSRSLDHFDPDAPRPIDVAFAGSRSARRSEQLDRISGVLARRSCRWQMLEDGDDGTPWTLLTQARVAINLHRGDDVRLEWRRVLDAIHAGAVVVTEHASDMSPLVPGEHLLAATADSLPYVVDALLDDEPRLAALRAAAYERITTWMPYALPVSVLRAALVELVGEPEVAAAEPELSRSAAG
ncbi:MAG: glycosyltransferase family protein [Solirubrobacteraceae bacterium]